MEFEEKIHQMKLFDIYKELLTPTQKKYLEQNLFEDYSLSEIAELHGISRSAVHDNIKKSIKTLQKYENKLGQLTKKSLQLEIIEQLKNCKDNQEIKNLIEELEQLI